jgi:hypothetical protein
MTMTKNKLAKAVTMAIAGTALSAGAVSTASAHVSYNTFTTTAASATDGWTRTYDNGTDTPGDATGPESQGNKGTVVPWLGTSGGALPFGYTGSSHLNWAAEIHNAGDSLEVSAADAALDYSGAVVEIDTGGGAWNDNGLNADGTVSSNGPTGWKHQTDIGLIKSHSTQNVTLNLSTIGGTFSRFGVTVFEGMDTNTGNYSHHGAWNRPGSTPALPFTASNPFGTTNLTNIGFSDNVDSTNGFTFVAEANKIYSIYLGGVGFSRWNAGVDGYALDITTSPVPLPAAVWLFGSALMGFLGLQKRKMTA